MAVDVSIVSCKSYNAEECRLALEQALAPFGGLDWVKDGMRVVIKVNLVSAMKPEQAATTHPALLCELTKMLRARGASVLLGDSPGGLYTAAHVNHVYDLSGMHACEAVGAELNQDFSQADASFPDAVCAKKFTYTAYLDQADAIIDFCKLKTHGMMGLTNAVKNYFGVIPGTMKPEYHYKYPQISDFSNMLIDLSTYFKPRICICDAVVGMEGNGPTQGSPRAIGAVLAAESASKLDLLAAKLIGLTADDVPTLQAARMRGLIPQTAEELNDIRESYCARDVYHSNPRIKRAVDTLVNGTVPTDSELRELYTSLLDGASWHRPDHYFVLKDLPSYQQARLQANRDYRDRVEFGRKCLMNVASAGYFSSDRTIRQYAKEIWKI